MELKLRKIVGGNRDVKGLTVPTEIATFFPNCYFNVKVSGACIVFYSGTCQTPNPQEVKNYNFEDCRVGSTGSIL